MSTDACQPSWRLNVDRQAPGALSSPVATTTVDRCKDVCLSFPNCIAIEFSSSSLSCGIHNSTNSLLSYVSTGTDLHVLLDRCTIVGESRSSMLNEDISKLTIIIIIITIIIITIIIIISTIIIITIIIITVTITTNIIIIVTITTNIIFIIIIITIHFNSV